MSKPFDATAKDLLEADPAGWVTFLGRPTAAGGATAIDADVSTVSADADKVIRVEGPAPWLLHVEFQSGRDDSLPRRLLQYNGILQRRHEWMAASAVVLLRRAAEAPNLTGTWPVHTPVGPDWEFRYSLVRVWERSPEEFLAGPLGLLPLAPLTDAAAPDLPAVVARMKARIDRDAPRPLGDMLWTATYILFGLRYDDAAADRLLAGVMQMEESTTYQAILRRGRQEGRVEESRNLLLGLGRMKFGQPSPEIESDLAAITDPLRLEQMHYRTSNANSWQEMLSEG